MWAVVTKITGVLHFQPTITNPSTFFFMSRSELCGLLAMILSRYSRLATSIIKVSDYGREKGIWVYRLQVQVQVSTSTS